MSTFFTIAIAVLVFGFLIFVHELGHYIFARIFKVKINEFSIGMGPKLLWYDSKKTGIRYAISMLPIGGYVAMAGEDDETDDPNSFDKKPAWQRLIITGAGAFVNIIVGFILISILVTMKPLGSTTISVFADPDQTGYAVSSEDSGLRVGDKIVEIEGKSVAIYSELSYEIARRGIKPLDFVVIRDGERVTVKDVVFPGDVVEGEKFALIDFGTTLVEKDFGSVVKYSFRLSAMTVRMCWESIYDLFTGRFSLNAVSGPVGISNEIGNAAREGIASLLHIAGLISINLGFMNLLPIPALDGGRLITTLGEIVTRRKIPKKVEGVINTVGLMLLLGLSFVILIKDVIKLIV